MVLFAVQVLVGPLAGTVYVLPNFLSETLPFNILRMIHTNAPIVWLLLGFSGSAYCLIPEEAEREIASPMLAYAALATSQDQIALGRLPDNAPDDAVKAGMTGIAGTHATLAQHLKSLAEWRVLPPDDQLKTERADVAVTAGAVTNPTKAR